MKIHDARDCTIRADLFSCSVSELRVIVSVLGSVLQGGASGL